MRLRYPPSIKNSTISGNPEKQATSTPHSLVGSLNTTGSPVPNSDHWLDRVNLFIAIPAVLHAIFTWRQTPERVAAPDKDVDLEIGLNNGNRNVLEYHGTDDGITGEFARNGIADDGIDDAST